MRFDEYRRHDATALAGLIAKGDVSAKEVLETAIARAEQVNPAINAIVHKQYDRARSAVAAGLPGGPLQGVPYLIKDLAFLEKGEPARLGSSLFKDYVADHDSAYVTRCKKAGLVIMGRTLHSRVRPQPEYRATPARLLPQSLEPRALGRRFIRRCRGGCDRRYPARRARHRRRRLDPHPGGPVRTFRPQAHARAHVAGAGCGRGLGRPLDRPRRQPQRARLGAYARLHRRRRAWRSLCGADARVLLRRGPRRPPRKLKIAMALGDHRGGKLHPECAKAVAGAAKLCAGLGHIVEEVEAPPDLVALRPMNSMLSAANVARALGCAGRRWDASRMPRTSSRSPGRSTSAASR